MHFSSAPRCCGEHEWIDLWCARDTDEQAQGPQLGLKPSNYWLVGISIGQYVEMKRVPGQEEQFWAVVLAAGASK